MMSCNDLDRLRTESARAKSTAWPPEAHEHLASCERCSQLQAVLDSSSHIVLADALQQKIEADILRDLRPIVPLPSVGRVMGMLVLAVAFVTAVANYFLGTAGWHARNSLQATVSFVLLGASVLALTYALAHCMTPGSRHVHPVWAYLACPLLALLAANSTMFGYHPNPQFVPQALWCWEIGVACAGLSAPIFWLVLRRGFPLNFLAQGAVTGLLAGLVGVTVLEIYCPQLDRLHISIAHIGAAITATLVGAAWGSIHNKIQRRAA